MDDVLNRLVSLVAHFEGCCLHAYRCPAGILTIGFGETLGVTEGMVWTQEEAMSRLKARLVSFLGQTLKKCPALYLEPPERLIACTSLAYNIGVGAFGASSVCRNTMRREYGAAARSFLLWDKGGGKVLPGLKTRRQLESRLYLSA